MFNRAARAQQAAGPTAVKDHAQRRYIAARPDLFMLDHDGRDHAFQLRIADLGAFQLFPAQPLRQFPTAFARFIRILARYIHPDPADLDIAGTGHGRDAAFSLDLRQQHAARQNGKQQRRRDKRDSQPELAAGSGKGGEEHLGHGENWPPFAQTGLDFQARKR